MTALADLKKLQAEYQQTFAKEGKRALKDAFKGFFVENPEFTAVQWTQCTPYFNDGDPCVFHVHDFSFRCGGPPLTKEELDEVGDSPAVDDYPADEEEAAGERTSMWVESYGLQRAVDAGLIKSTAAAKKKIDKLLKEFNGLEEVFLEVFGDHAQVVATEKGFRVTKYEHD